MSERQEKGAESDPATTFTREHWAVCIPIYLDGGGRRELELWDTLEEAEEARKYLWGKVAPLAWIEQITTVTTREIVAPPLVALRVPADRTESHE